MGLYDNFKIESSGRYMSTYAGEPIEEVAALGETLNKAYDRGLEGVTAFTTMRDNVQVLDADQEFKNKVFDDSQKQLAEYAKKGDYENAIPAVIKASQGVSGNKDLRKARAAFESVEKFKASLDKRYESGKIEKWQYDNALDGLSQYEGVSSGKGISSFIRQPSAPVDIRSLMSDAAKEVRAETVEGPEKWNSKLGKWGITTTKTYNPAELDAAMATALGNPEAQSYLSEMRQAYGDASVDQMLEQNRISVAASMHSTDPSTRYYEAGDGGGPNSTNRSGNQGSYNNLPIGKVEGVDYVNVGSKMGVDINNREADAGQAFFTNNLSFEERSKIGEELAANEKAQKNSLTRWGTSVMNSIHRYVSDIPDEEDIAEYEKLSVSAMDYNDISQEEWDGYSGQEKDNKISDYIGGAGRQQQVLQVHATDVFGEINSKILPDRAAKWSSAEVGDHLAKDISRNAQSRVFYDLEEQEISRDDVELQKALRGEKGYSFTVLGDADSRNNYGFSEENPSLANSYVINLRSDKHPDGKNYLVSKGDKYQENDAAEMEKYKNKPGFTDLPKISNRDFQSKVSEIYNTFPAPSYTTEYEDDNGVSFTGKRNKDDMNSITISRLRTKYGEIDLQQFAASYPGTVYDPVKGELSGLNDTQIAELVYSIGLR